MNVTALQTGVGLPSIRNGRYFHVRIPSWSRTSYAGNPVDLSILTSATSPVMSRHSLNEPMTLGTRLAAILVLVTSSGRMFLSPAMRFRSIAVGGAFGAGAAGEALAGAGSARTVVAGAAGALGGCARAFV